MKKQGGNFLLQALLALALIVAFMPFLASRLASRDKDAQMSAVSNQIETAQTASRIYLRENLNNLNYNLTTISGDAFSDTLEPYGLPLGFVPRTIFDQDISLVINKTETDMIAYLELSGGKLTEFQQSELIRRIGIYASSEKDIIYVIVPLDEVFSDLVRRNDTNPDDNGFLSDLHLGGFAIDGVNNLFARNSELGSLQTNSLSLFGIEDGRKTRNKIEKLSTNRSTFQSVDGEAALTITRGVLNVENISAKTISGFGDTGNLISSTASVYDFSMTAGRTGFTGPAKWDVKGNLLTNKINFSIDVLEISSSINTARGQEVYVNPDDLEYSAKSGIEVSTIRTANITLRDQTSAALERGDVGAIILDIRPSGTSALPDVLITSINNSDMKIILNPSDTNGKTTDCKAIISGLDGIYNQNSLSQSIICQYVFWQRLEKRIDIKKCLMDGRSDCI